MPVTPASERAHEERVKNGRKGGIASGKARRNKKLLKDCLEILLEKKMTTKSGEKITGAEAMATSIFKAALDGNMKAWELVRDTAGQKPVEKIEQTNTEIVVDLNDWDENED